jgi:SWI/SNF-related matrix-associated actin-dependent regulator of chromatin subfamily A member 5
MPYTLKVTTYDTIKAPGFGHVLKRMVWRAVFLDEGHRIKNESSEVSKACYALKTRFRVVLTGTPVQNNLHEFGALLRFLAPNIFTDLTLFDGAFELQKGKEHIDKALLANAHYLMRPFVLRRLKSEVEQKLPPKVETKINCPMSETQNEVTRLLLLRDRDMLTRMEGSAAPPGAGVGGVTTQGGASSSEEPGATGAGTVLTNQNSTDRLMSLLTQLRKAANHPFLFPGIEKVALDGRATEDIVSMSGKMKMLDRMLGQLYEKGHRVVLFSQYTRTLDIISDYLDMRGYRHTRLDGSTNRVMREVKINFFNKEKSPMFIFCLSTR